VSQKQQGDFMKLNKNVFLGVALFAASSVLSTSLVVNHSHNYANLKMGMRSIAQSAAPTFEDAKNYYLSHVNPNGVAVSNWYELANEIINDHIRSAQGRGGLILVNNVGPSDGDFKDKEQIQRQAKIETIQLAQQLQAQNGGGTIVQMAGNTNTGVGNIITAVQDAEFVKHVEKTYNVRVVTAGLSAYHAALNHGPDRYGANFMNTGLNFTALVPTAQDVWTVIVKGISSVVHISANFAELASAKGVVGAGSIFVLREGGPIAIEEGTMMITELDRKAKESGKSPNKIVKMIVQQGIQSGITRGEIRANKGTAGVTDLMVSLSRMMSQDPSFKNTLESLKIELQRFNSAGVLSFKGDLTSESISKTLLAFQASEEGKIILQKAEQYVKEVRAVEASSVDADTKKAQLAEIDKKLGILDAATLKTIDMDSVNKHKAAARVRAFANSYIAYLQAVTNISKAYAENAKDGKAKVETAKSFAEASEKLKSSAEKALQASNLETKDGKVVRSIETDVTRAVKRAKR
jgi:hypothetical protein